MGALLWTDYCKETASHPFAALSQHDLERLAQAAIGGWIRERTEQADGQVMPESHEVYFV